MALGILNDHKTLFINRRSIEDEIMVKNKRKFVFILDSGF